MIWKAAIKYFILIFSITFLFSFWDSRSFDELFPYALLGFTVMKISIIEKAIGLDERI